MPLLGGAFIYNNHFTTFNIPARVIGIKMSTPVTPTIMHHHAILIPLISPPDRKMIFRALHPKITVAKRANPAEPDERESKPAAKQPANFDLLLKLR